MTNRLIDIDLFWDDTSLVPSREAAICYARNDIQWLMEQIKSLTAERDLLQAQLDEAVKVLEKINNGGVPNGVVANVEERMLEMCRLSGDFLAQLKARGEK